MNKADSILIGIVIGFTLCMLLLVLTKVLEI